MSIAGLDYVDVTSFRGPILQPQTEVSDVPTDASLLAENVTYMPGKVKTREGHEAVYGSLGYTPRSIANWTYGGNWLLTLTGSNVVRTDLSNGANLTLGASTANRASFQSVGNKLFMAFRGSTGASAGEARVWNSLTYSKIAPAPLSITPSISQLSSGGVTAGTHRIAYIVQSLTGYLGRPGPESFGTFVPTSFTATGGKNVTVSLTGDWPTWASAVWILMTTVANPEKYFFVPGATAGVPGGATGWTVGVTFDCSDERLELVADEATDNFFLATQDASGNGPISPTHCFAYGQRMVYIAGDTAYFSEPQNYEAMALDRNAVKLPGGQTMTSGGEIRGVCYLVGPSYTYSTQEAGVGEAPSTWPAPTLVSGSIGTPAAHGFAVNSDYGFAWVAAEAGLYCFDGVYPEIPASYYQTPAWERINWAAAHLIEVIDHTPSQRVFVLAPLDGATSNPTHQLVFDYSEGRTADRIKFSLDDITGVTPACQALVRNQTSGRLDVWLGTNAGTGAVIRRYSRAEVSASPTTKHNDLSAAIRSLFKTAIIPKIEESRPIKLRHRAADLRITGNGTVSMYTSGLDDTKTSSAKTITLAAAPGNLVRKRFHFISPGATYRIENTLTANHYFQLSGIRSYFASFL